MAERAVYMRPIPSLIALLISGSFAVAEPVELSLYGGMASVRNGQVSGDDPGGAGLFDFVAGWQGSSGATPSQFGVRLTWWPSQTLGWGLDFNSSAVQVDQAILDANGISDLNLSNGINLLTLNAYRRWPDAGALRPYVGAGIGVAIPTVEFDAGGTQTSQIQLTGPAVRLVAGASFPLSDRVSVFGEYEGSYSVNSADLSSGGTLNTNIQSSAVNIGVSLGF